MSNLIDKIRSSQNPLIDRLRGLNPFRGELVFPTMSTDPLDEEVKNLKSKYSPDQVFEALKTKMPEAEAHKRVYGFEPNPNFKPAMQQETEGLIKALKATPEAFNSPVTAATGLAEIASKKLGASDKLAQGVGLAAGLVLPVPGNKAQKLNKGIKLTEELLWSRKDKLDDVLKEVMPKLQKENPSVWMELSDPFSKIKSGKFTNEDLNQVDEILKLNKLGNYKPVPKENVVDLSNPLITEARKYKSAEDFVKALENPIKDGRIKLPSEPQLVFRGSRKPSGTPLELGTSPIQKGKVFFTEHRQIAQRFTGQKKGGNLEPFYLDYKKPLEYGGGRELTDAQRKIRNEILQSDNPKKIADKYGYDALVEFDDGGARAEIILFDPAIAKTKSQLTDIWNKANKK